MHLFPCQMIDTKAKYTVMLSENIKQVRCPSNSVTSTNTITNILPSLSV